MSKTPSLIKIREVLTNTLHTRGLEKNLRVSAMETAEEEGEGEEDAAEQSNGDVLEIQSRSIRRCPFRKACRRKDLNNH